MFSCETFLTAIRPGRVTQSVGHLTHKSWVLGSIPGLATYFRFSSTFSRRAVVSYWRKYVHEVLVYRLGGLSLPRKSVVRLTDHPDMTLDVYRGRKKNNTTTTTAIRIYQPSSLVLIIRPSGLSAHPPEVQAIIPILYSVWGIRTVMFPEKWKKNTIYLCHICPK